METDTLKPYITIIILMVCTSVALAYTVDVTLTDEAGIRVVLPDRVGLWEGAEVRYCHNVACESPRSFLVPDLEAPDVCPSCGEPLYTMERAEKQLLPGDTAILKKQYLHPDGRKVFAAIVLSGKERASIHRPQVCLVGQGRQIVGDETIEVPMEHRKPLDVMILDLHEAYTRGDRILERTTYYAYWFVGKDRETPSHTRRMFWMAADRIFRNVAHRWAYISVSGLRESQGHAHEEEVRSFVRDLYPQIVREDV